MIYFLWDWFMQIEKCCKIFMVNDLIRAYSLATLNGFLILLAPHELYANLHTSICVILKQILFISDLRAMIPFLLKSQFCILAMNSQWIQGFFPFLHTHFSYFPRLFEVQCGSSFSFCSPSNLQLKLLKSFVACFKLSFFLGIWKKRWWHDTINAKFAKK